ncbi:MAG: hypothetical protein HY658_04555 [Actinobacteria bacterium]|nr:hypothetical protein [Actinomycetota bacterium]
MGDTTRATARRRERDAEGGGSMRGALYALGLAHLALGAWQAFSPESFFRSLGGFGLWNPHYIRDVATFYLALGAGLLVAAGRPAWRVPVVAVTAFQYALHSVNHAFDVRLASPAWVGYADLVALLAVTAVLLLLLSRLLAAERSP